MKRGFTLVELSIVLVIIGLLIGGILVGQSMIGSAKLLTFGKQIASYDIAISNFQTKYNALPGDSPLVQGDVCGDPEGCDNDSRQDNDGYIQGRYDYNDVFSGENASIWNVISTTETLSNESYSYPVIGAPIIAGKSVPKAKMGFGGQILIVSGHTQGVYDNRHWFEDNFYWIGSLANTTASGFIDLITPNPSATGGNFSAVEAMSIDTKFDDGNAITGNIRASGHTSRDNLLDLQPQCADGGSGAYNSSSGSGYYCSLAIKLFSVQR